MPPTDLVRGLALYLSNQWDMGRSTPADAEQVLDSHIRSIPQLSSYIDSTGRRSSIIAEAISFAKAKDAHKI